MAALEGERLFYALTVRPEQLLRISLQRPEPARLSTLRASSSSQDAIVSYRGIHGVLTDGKEYSAPVLLVGSEIPRIHHSDGIPIYLVVEDDDAGIPVRCKNGRLRNLLTYPSHWPTPGSHDPELWAYATHERLPWDALIPCFIGADR